MDSTKRVADVLAALVAVAVVSAAAQRDTIHKIGLFDTTNSQLANLLSFKAMPLAAAAFGAKCDDVTNDAPAINAALTEAGHVQFASLGAGSQIVALPPGICRINTTLRVPGSVVLQGLGRTVTEIKIGAGWANPTPNALVRLGDTTPIFGARVENLTINALGAANVISLYAKSIQNQSGARNVVLRAFGARGVQVDSGGTLEANAYMLEHLEAMNGIAGTGIGFDLNSKTTFSPTLVDLGQSNATFPNRLAPAGVKLAGGFYRLYNTGAEFDSACVNAAAGATAELYGLSCNLSVDAFRTAQSSSMAFGVTNTGGTNLIKDNILNITIPVSGNNYLPSYLGGAYTAAASTFALRKCELAYSTNIAVNVHGCALFRATVTNGRAFTIQAPTGILSTTSNQTQFITFDIYNNSGRTMGAIHWAGGAGGYRLAGTFTNPTKTRHRTITFLYDEQANAWRELSRAAADIPN